VSDKPAALVSVAKRIEVQGDITTKLTNFLKAGLVGAIGKYRGQVIHRLTLLSAHLVRMHLMSRRDLLHRRSPQSASSATLALKSAVNRHRFVISVFLLKGQNTP
jgi:hypothetical protein